MSCRAQIFEFEPKACDEEANIATQQRIRRCRFHKGPTSSDIRTIEFVTNVIIVADKDDEVIDPVSVACKSSASMENEGTEATPNMSVVARLGNLATSEGVYQDCDQNIWGCIQYRVPQSFWKARLHGWMYSLTRLSFLLWRASSKRPAV